MTDIILVYTTCSSEEEAAKMARQLVQERLVACVQISAPVRSVYRWKGVVEDGPEVVLAMKSRRDLVGELERRVGEMHSYEVPEFVVVGVEGVSRGYGAWLEEELRPVAGKGDSVI